MTMQLSQGQKSSIVRQFNKGHSANAIARYHDVEERLVVDYLRHRKMLAAGSGQSFAPFVTGPKPAELPTRAHKLSAAVRGALANPHQPRQPSLPKLRFMEDV